MLWKQRVWAGVIAACLAISAELVAQYITGDFRLLRLSLALAGALLLAWLMSVLVRRVPRKRIVIDLVLLVLGIAAGTLGASSFFFGSPPEPRELAFVGTALVTLGSAVCLVAAYSIYIDLAGRDVDFIPQAEWNPHEVIAGEGAGVDLTETHMVGLRREDERVAARVRSALSVNDLHFIAYYVNGKCMLMADVLRSERLDPFFLKTDRDMRRRLYERAGRQIIWLNKALSQSLSKIEGGILIRTVLDVEDGALYYFRVTDGVDLIGVTLIQDRVLVADNKMQALAGELGTLPRGGKLAWPTGGYPTPAIEGVLADPRPTRFDRWAVVGPLAFVLRGSK